MQWEHGAIGVELAGGLGERFSEVLERVTVHLDPGLGRRAGQGLLGREQIGLGDQRQDHRCARLELLADSGLETARDSVLSELADDPTGSGTDCDRCQQRRCGEPDEHTDAATPTSATLAELVAGLLNADVAVVVLLHEHDAVGLHVREPTRPMSRSKSAAAASVFG